MTSVQTYLIFSGNCEEAVKHYCDVFGGKIQLTQRYKDGPTDVSSDWRDKILHLNFIIRGEQLMASDGFPGNMPSIGNNVQISVNFKKDEVIDEMFSKLSHGGRITMPLQNTFWKARFGQLVDRFGVSWMFNQPIE